MAFPEGPPLLLSRRERWGPGDSLAGARSAKCSDDQRQRHPCPKRFAACGRACARLAPAPMENPNAGRPAARAPKVSFVSLGCPKALVDSERIITRLRAEGYELARAHAGADLVVVNTCGFLDSAQAESLEAIGKAVNENGRVIVTGCMGAEPEKITA